MAKSNIEREVGQESSLREGLEAAIRHAAPALHGAQVRNLIAKAPKHTHEAVREDYHRIVYAANREAAEKALEAFLLK